MTCRWLCRHCPESPSHGQPQALAQHSDPFCRALGQLHSVLGQWSVARILFFPGSRTSFFCFLWNVRDSMTCLKVLFSSHFLFKLGERKDHSTKCSKNFGKLWKYQTLTEIPINAISINWILLKFQIKRNIWLGIYSKAYSTILVPKEKKKKKAQVFQGHDT